MHVVYHDTFFFATSFLQRDQRQGRHVAWKKLCPPMLHLTQTTFPSPLAQPTRGLHSNECIVAPTIAKPHCQTPLPKPHRCSPPPQKIVPPTTPPSPPLSPTCVSPTYATGHTSAPAPPTETCRVVPPPSGATNDFSNCPVWQSRNPTFWPP